MAGLNRNIVLETLFSEQEICFLKKRMSLAGAKKYSAFLRKMALDGLIIKLDIPELREMISLMCEIRDGIRSLAETSAAAPSGQPADLAEIKQKQDVLIRTANDIIQKLSSIR